MAHSISRIQKNKKTAASTPLWEFRRKTAWRQVAGFMKDAGLDGPHASPRGLRHAFCCNAIRSGIPVSTVSQWMGHGSPEFTEQYYQGAGLDRSEADD